MALTITKISVATPTSPSAVLAAGGNLTVGITYYYRIIAIRNYGSGIQWSSPTAEISATPTAGNQTINLNWTTSPNAVCYVIQRAIVSGSYPVCGQNTLNPRSAFSYYSYGMIPTSLADDGTIYWDSYNLDYTSPLDCIDVTGTGAEIATLYDIYAEDQAQGWGLIDICFPAGAKGFVNTNFRDEVPYVCDAGLAFSNCAFRLRGILILKQGGIVTNPANVTLEFGDSSFQYCPTILHNSFYLIGKTNDGKSYAGVVPHRFRLWGKSGSGVYNFFMRPFSKKNNSRPYMPSNWHDGTYDGTYKNCTMGLGASNSMPIRAGAYEDNVFEGCRPSISRLRITTPKTIYSGEGITFRWAQNVIVDDPVILHSGAFGDATWGGSLGAVFIDGEFRGKGQVDNIPYYGCQCSSPSYIGHTMLRCSRLGLIVVSANGDPMLGALVIIEDANGNSDIWEDSGEEIRTYLNSTDVTSSFLTTDSSAFSIGEVLRLENYAEAYEVIAIDDPSLNYIKVSRGAQGTIKREISPSGQPRILRQLPSVTTNADGEIDLDIPLLYKELVIAKNGGSYFQSGYENDLVVQGWLSEELRTPHTITISKSSYRTRVIPLTMDRKREEVEMLEKPGIPTEQVLSFDVQEEQITADIQTQQITCDIVEESIEADIVEESIEGAVEQESITASVED